MKQRFFAALLAVTVSVSLLIAGTQALAAQPVPAGYPVYRATGTVELVHARQGTVVINDREYLLPAGDASARAAIRGARVEFAYREARPLPIITEISKRR
jgi:hypothetical protein